MQFTDSTYFDTAIVYDYIGGSVYPCGVIVVHDIVMTPTLNFSTNIGSDG